MDERYPEIVVARELQVRRHDADDGRHESIDGDGAPQHVRVASVTALPDVVADDEHRRRTRPLVFRQEIPPENRLLADHPEDVRRDVHARESVGLSSGFAHVEGEAAPEHQTLERRLLIPPVLEVGEGDAALASVRVPVARADPHDAVGVVEGEPPEQHRVDEGEHRRVHPDAQRQGRGRYNGKPAILCQEASGETDVLPERHWSSVDRTDVRTFDASTSGKF